MNDISRYYPYYLIHHNKSKPVSHSIFPDISWGVKSWNCENYNMIDIITYIFDLIYSQGYFIDPNGKVDVSICHYPDVINIFHCIEKLIPDENTLDYHKLLEKYNIIVPLIK